MMMTSRVAETGGLRRLEVSEQRLQECLLKMHRRVWELGLERFDSTDALSHPLFLRLQLGNRRFNGYYGLRLIEYFAPLLCRRLLGVRPTLTPSTLYHLGNAYLSMLACEQLTGNNPSGQDWGHFVRQLTDLAWETRLPGEHAAWAHPHGMHKGDWVRPELQRPGIPDSCCHHTTRLGRLIIDAGRHWGDETLLARGGAAVDALLEYHNWRVEPSGAHSISYYPDTDDGTINTAAEVAALLACLPTGQFAEAARQRLRGIVRLLVDEQGDAGQWRYASREHESRLGRSGDPDNHHTAMNLAALAEVHASGRLNSDLTIEVERATERGVNFYLDQFTREDGFCFGELGQSRCAEITGYCEGAKMLLLVARLPQVSESLRSRVLNLVPRMVEKAIDLFYRPSTGDVGCNRRFGRTYCVRSIRWGSGPLMEAIAACLQWNAEVDASSNTGHCLPLRKMDADRAVA